MRYLSVCSGIEAASVAWKPLGWECAGVSEIDKFPRAVLEHRLGAVPVDDDHRWQPGQNFTPLFGDFTKIEAHHVGPIDLLVGGTPCFPAGTTVATARGLIPIEQVEAGDMVWTHRHRFQRVLRTGFKEADTLRLIGQGHYGMVTTANHPFLARQKMARSTRVSGKAVRQTWITDQDWIAAEGMAGKHWACVSQWPNMGMPPISLIGNEVMPKISQRDLMLIAGAYLGDGWVRISARRGAIMFGLNADKLNALRPALDAYGNWHATQERSVIKVGLCSRPLARWLSEQFGSGAAGKRVPMWVLGHPERRALLEGYLLTDGGPVEFGHRATTVSRDLALTMRMLAVSCGYSSSVAFTERPANHVIEGRTVNQRDTYTVSFGTSARSSFEDGGFRWQLVRKAEATGKVETVYDLEVEEDHSYVADGICVHNCQSFSIAGKRLGLDDPRGNLTLEFLALAKRIRPTWLVYENVPGLLSHDGGRTFGTFLGLLAECGFERWAYRVLDAQYVRTRRFGRAVPQRRRRVFLVGYSGAADINPAAVLFDRESLRGNPAPRRQVGERPAPTLAARTRGGGGLGTDFDCDGGLIAGQDWPASVAPTLNAAFGSKLGLEDQHVRGGGGLFVPGCGDVPQCRGDGPQGCRDGDADSYHRSRLR
jgi:site-specific DNA-cytosine methylase